ncbi:hypothetical protein Q3G72_019814 [Acer saccharum]|nr:hypothetical protein Q3G72_019814 [Acer saccharum]
MDYEHKGHGNDISGPVSRRYVSQTKILHMMNDKSAVFSLGLLQRFHNLEKLVLSISSYKEIFSYDRRGNGESGERKENDLVGGVLGDPVLVDVNTLQRRRLDKGRVLVLLPFGCRCPEKLEVVVDRKSLTVSVEQERSPVEIQWLEEQLGLEMEDSLADLNSFLDLEREGKKSEKGESSDPFRLKGKFESDIIVRRDRKLREDQGKESRTEEREVVAVNFRSKSFQDIGKKFLASKPNSRHILFKVCKAKLVVEKRGEISSTEGSAENGPNVDGSNSGLKSSKVSTIRKSNQLKDYGSGHSRIGVGPKQFSPIKSSVGFVRGPVGSIHTNEDQLRHQLKGGGRNVLRYELNDLNPISVEAVNRAEVIVETLYNLPKRRKDRKYCLVWLSKAGPAGVKMAKL